jgi:hypothetical protein
MGAGVVAAGAALMAFEGYLEGVSRAAERLHQNNLKLIESTRAVTEELQRQLAARGILNSEPAANKGTAELRQMKAEGFKEDVAKGVLAQAFDQAGNQVLTDEEIRRATALKEATPDAFDDKAKPGTIRAALARERSRKVIDATLKAMQDTRDREQEDILAGGERGDVAIKKRMEREGVSLDDAALKDIKDVAKHGEVQNAWMDFGSRQASAVDRARSLGLITQGQAGAVRDRNVLGQMGRSFNRTWDESAREANSWFGFEQGKREASGLPSPAETDRPAPQPATTITNHGVINMGSSGPKPQPRMTIQ